MTENLKPGAGPKLRGRQRTAHAPEEAISPAVQVQTPQQAHRLLNDAAILRDDAEHYGWAVEHFDDADNMEAAALAYLYPEPDQSIVPDQGELVPLAAKPAIRRSPKVAALADHERLDLANEARADELAIDMEESVTAQTSIEKAMVHQLAAAHALALRLVGRANLEIEGMGRFDRQGQRETMVEVARLSNAAARLMQTYQQGALALTKIRGGGAQTIVVQHVQVNDGGQAVIAGQARGASGNGCEDGN
jgi:hypothetical protein